MSFNARTTCEIQLAAAVSAIAALAVHASAQSIVTGPGAGVQPMLRTFSSPTGIPHLNFLAFGAGATGGVRVAGAHISASLCGDLISGTGPGPTGMVKVFNGSNGSLLNSFYAYGPSYIGGVYVAAGDVTGDGISEVITGTDVGAAPHVKAFSAANSSEIRSFFAYSPGFTGGVRVASGDITGDGIDDIITGCGPATGSTPHVKVFDGVNGVEVRSFLAFGSGWPGGIFVASGDINGDGRDDIIVSADAGATPAVVAFSGVNNAVLLNTFAFESNFSGGVRVAAQDMNNDGKDDIIAARGPGGEPEVRILSGAGGAVLGSFNAEIDSFTGGCYVGGVRYPLNTCHQDIAPLPNGDDAIDVNDLLMVITNWGPCPDPQSCRADVTPFSPGQVGDDTVDVNDLLMIITSWGACP